MAVFRNPKNWGHAQRFGWSKTLGHCSKTVRIKTMARRANPRKAKTHRNYTIEEAAEALSVSIPTVRNWIKNGLPALTSKTPYLILGQELRTFLEEKRQSKRTVLEPGQVFCLACRKARFPDGRIADYIPRNATLGTLVGLCPTCGTICNRFFKQAGLPGLAGILDVAVKGGG